MKRQCYLAAVVFTHALYLPFYSVRACHREEEFIKVVNQDELPLIDPIKIVSVSGRVFCSMECTNHDVCKSFVFLNKKSTENCLMSRNPDGERSDEVGETYKRQSSTPKVCLENHCQKGGICIEACNEPFYSCVCPSGTEGRFCQHVMSPTHFASAPWTLWPGTLKQLDSAVGTWGVASDSTVWFWEGQWTNIPGLLSHISSGESGIWAVNSYRLVFMRLGVTAAKPKGVKWFKVVPGKLTQITSGSFGVVYGIHSTHKLFYRQGINITLPQGSLWKLLPGLFQHVACGKFGCWAIKTDNNVVFRTAVTSSSPGGVAWVDVAGHFKQLDVGVQDGDVYALDLQGKLYNRDGVTEENPTGMKWVCIDDVYKFSHVSIGASGRLFGINANGAIYAWP